MIYVAPFSQCPRHQSEIINFPNRLKKQTRKTSLTFDLVRDIVIVSSNDDITYRTASLYIYIYIYIIIIIIINFYAFLPGYGWFLERDL